MAMSRRWCFTINNWTDEEYEAMFEWPAVDYMVAGKEVGESGTNHIQGFVRFTVNMRLSAVKKLNARAHWEITRGTTRQAADYCKKEGDFEEVGEMPMTAEEKGEMERARWEEIRQKAKSGDIETIEPQVYVVHYRTLKEIARDHMAQVAPLKAPCGIWIWGQAGVGKSYYARKTWPEHFIKELNKWWDGYSNEVTVIVDDMDPNYASAFGRLFKIWSDAYPFVAETKGGAIRIRPERFVVTSQYRIDEVWSDKETLAAIKRRFTEIKMLPESKDGELWKEEAQPPHEEEKVYEEV